MKTIDVPRPFDLDEVRWYGPSAAGCGCAAVARLALESPFPAYGVLDGFARPDADPIGWPWAPVPWAAGPLRLEAGQAAGGAGSTGGAWLTAFGGDCDLAADVALEGGAVGLALVVDPTVLAWSGFVLSVVPAVPGPGAVLTLQTWDAGAAGAVVIPALEVDGFSAGAGVGVRRVGEAWGLFVRLAGVWLPVGPGGSSAAYRAPLVPVLTIAAGAASRLDDFSGGPEVGDRWYGWPGEHAERHRGAWWCA